MGDFIKVELAPKDPGGLGFGVWGGLGFGIWGLGLRIQGMGLGKTPKP